MIWLSLKLIRQINNKINNLHSPNNNHNSNSNKNQ